MDRSSAAGSGTTVSADKLPRRRGSGPADDAQADGRDRHNGGCGQDGGDATSGSDDPERPTLKKRTPTEMKANAKKKDLASVKGATDLNDDPDRPNLHRGKPAGRLDEEDIPPLKVCRRRCSRGWRCRMRRRGRSMSFCGFGRARRRRQRLRRRCRRWRGRSCGSTAMGSAAGPSAAAPAAAAQGAGAPARSAASDGGGEGAGGEGQGCCGARCAPVALGSESLKAYTLSYGGAATYVYSATSAGRGWDDAVCAVVAQRDPLGSLQVAMANVTDSAHLDRAPWMRLVDAVDAEASNRASLLFELRGQSSRQFALYRVIGAKSEQLFATETCRSSASNGEDRGRGCSEVAAFGGCRW